MLKRIALLAVIIFLPFAAAAFAKPVWLVQPIAGVSCIRDVLCTDDTTRLNEAEQLYDESFTFVAASVAPLEKRPLVVFCASEECYGSFGFRNASAKSIGSFCIVISPRGWKPYYLRHEMIHRLQAQQLGAMRMYFEPEWFVEGMAYSLSEDPRPEIAEPFQTFRSKFDAWYQGVGKDKIWVEAKRL